MAKALRRLRQEFPRRVIRTGNEDSAGYADQSNHCSAAVGSGTVMFALRLLLGGIGCALIGIWWSIDGLTDGFMNEVIGGLVWKGPLLGVAGVAAAFMGYRMLSDKGSTSGDEGHGEPSAAADGGRDSGS